MNRIRVLLVDDHTILREGIRALLGSSETIEVVGEASNGREAIERAKALNPDVVLMDIGMPEMNGLEATRAIRQQVPGTRVLILSMHDSDEYIVPALEAGASGYVLKRSAPAELERAIAAAHAGESYLHPAVAKKLIDRTVTRRQSSPGEVGLDVLSEREIEVLTLIADGLSTQEIAQKLYISPKTVQAHRANIMEKLDMHDRVELVKFAIKKGLVHLGNS